MPIHNMTANKLVVNKRPGASHIIHAWLQALKQASVLQILDFGLGGGGGVSIT